MYKDIKEPHKDTNNSIVIVLISTAQIGPECLHFTSRLLVLLPNSQQCSEYNSIPRMGLVPRSPVYQISVLSTTLLHTTEVGINLCFWIFCTNQRVATGSTMFLEVRGKGKTRGEIILQFICFNNQRKRKERTIFL